MIDISDIEAAAARARGVVRETPLLSSPAIDAAAGRRVLVKAECLQFTGSFKFRGGWSALSSLTEAERKRGVIAYSSGNHAQGVAHAAELLGAPAVIVMPADAPKLKLENTRGYGAEVVTYDRAGGERREDVGAAIVAERGLHLIKPYDDARVMAGQGTCGLEIARQAAELGVTEGEVLTCCGGGGLTSGIATALAALAPGFRVRPVEPVGFEDVKRSLEIGTQVRNNGPETGFCDAILTPSPGDLTFPILKAHCGPGLSVSDDQVRAAMRAAFLHLKIVVEPGGAVALAAALFAGDQLEGDSVIVTASGGNVDAGVFAEVIA